MQIHFVLLTVWIAGFLFALNIALAIIFRARPKWEVISYYAVCAVELAVFVFALLYQLSVITQVPYHLPPGLPLNGTQLGAALAIVFCRQHGEPFHLMTHRNIGDAVNRGSVGALRHDVFKRRSGTRVRHAK